MLDFSCCLPNLNSCSVFVLFFVFVQCTFASRWSRTTRPCTRATRPSCTARPPATPSPTSTGWLKTRRWTPERRGGKQDAHVRSFYRLHVCSLCFFMEWLSSCSWCKLFLMSIILLLLIFLYVLEPNCERILWYFTVYTSEHLAPSEDEFCGFFHSSNLYWFCNKLFKYLTFFFFYKNFPVNI